MGQCSTLPAEARGDHHRQYGDNSAHSNYNEQTRYRSKDMTMEPSSDNSTTPLNQRRTGRPSGYHLQVQTGQSNQKAVPHALVNPAASPHSHLPPSGPPRQQQQQHHQQHGAPFGIPPMSSPPQHQRQMVTPLPPQPMQEEREGIPPPPDCALRQRCYKLNLESDLLAATASNPHGHIYGPFLDVPPPLTYSGSEDSADHTDATTVAIQTAQIFRGITVAKDGTILSQNARATKSSRAKSKRGEQSRQAAKIDKAKDLVEEAVLTGKNADDSDCQMVSLVIVGEYDEMKQLVRDGSKKLRDANGLPDDALLAVNRPRGSSPLRNPVLSPSRKRVSPFALGSPHSAGNPKSPSNKSRHLANSAPPKLKGHPRDPSRRMDDGRQNSRRGFSPLHDPCNDMFNQNADSDWGSSLGLSRGLNSIWYCGGNGGSAGSTMSPTQSVKDSKGGYPVSPQQRKPIIEGRNESSYRGMRVSERMEPPGHHQAVHA